MITIVTEITTAVAANPENSTVSTINFFLQVLNENIFLQITTLTTKITSISSSLVCQMMKDNGTEACDCWSNDNFTALGMTIRSAQVPVQVCDNFCCEGVAC